MSFPNYDEYKDSDVTWLGEVPSHWSVDRIKHSTESCRNGIWGNEAQDDENDIPCIRVADFDWSRLRVNSTALTIRNVFPAEQKHRILRPGNLILEKSGGGDKQLVGRVVLYEYNWPAVCSNFTARVVLKTGMVPSYWKYLHAAAYDVRLNYPSIKQTSGIQNLDQQSYFDERCGYPPYDEQRAIARFLDHETAKIDALVAEQRRLIELLKEKRQAVISHAVTKGLDPNVPMKESEIAWLGRIPKHWKTVPLKWVIRCTSGDSIRPDDIQPEQEASYPVIGGNGVIGYTSTFNAPPATIVVGRVGALCGNVHLSTDQCWVTDNALQISDVDSTLVSGYLKIAVEALDLNDLANKTAQPLITSSQVKNQCISVPSREEQMRIYRWVVKAIGAIDGLIADTNKSIGLLTERRSALISTAVTGKIDVRNWQPPADATAAETTVQSTEANA